MQRRYRQDLSDNLDLRQEPDDDEDDDEEDDGSTDDDDGDEGYSE